LGEIGARELRIDNGIRMDKDIDSLDRAVGAPLTSVSEWVLPTRRSQCGALDRHRGPQLELTPVLVRGLRARYPGQRAYVRCRY
jgi:hypothetical protein